MPLVVFFGITALTQSNQVKRSCSQKQSWTCQLVDFGITAVAQPFLGAKAPLGSLDVKVKVRPKQKSLEVA